MPQTITERAVKIPPSGLDADLTLPPDAAGIILFAHGSGSSRHSPRNRSVAGVLNDGGFGTLLLDLLTHAEEQVDLRTRHLRFDIGLLAGRLIEATEWVRREPELGTLPIGYFGASTGAAAALVAAARHPAGIDAVVSRGGRPDLAGPALRRVQAPTLLIVGGEDLQVMELNLRAISQMVCKKDLAIIPGATHLFEEPGALKRVSHLALGWLTENLKKRRGPRLN